MSCPVGVSRHFRDRVALTDHLTHSYPHANLWWLILRTRFQLAATDQAHQCFHNLRSGGQTNTSRPSPTSLTEASKRTPQMAQAVLDDALHIFGNASRLQYIPIAATSEGLHEVRVQRCYLAPVRLPGAQHSQCLRHWRACVLACHCCQHPWRREKSSEHLNSRDAQRMTVQLCCVLSTKIWACSHLAPSVQELEPCGHRPVSAVAADIKKMPAAGTIYTNPGWP
mmetsp:Transcript_42232/g.99154  ORF Transcript_42232/g.99154 Transcript_42232/m.99154 type:complete len:225 (-) Transcript_42232:2402-3076(-)